MKTATVKLKSFLSSLFSQEIKEMKDDIRRVKNSIHFKNSEDADFKMDHHMMAENVKCLDNECISMRTTISVLNNRNNLLEQQTRSHNIELQFMPESKTENICNFTGDES